MFGCLFDTALWCCSKSRQWSLQPQAVEGGRPPALRPPPLWRVPPTPPGKKKQPCRYDQLLALL